MKPYTSEVKKKVLCLSNSDVTNTWQSLFKIFGINYFVYSRLYLDGSCFAFTNGKEFAHYYMENQFTPMFFTFVPTGIHLWKQFMPNSAHLYAEKNFKYFSGIILLKKYENYIEQIELAECDQDNHTILMLFCNKRPLFNNFIHFFKERAVNIINQANKERFVIPKKLIQSNQCGCQYSAYSDNIFAKNKFHFTYNSREVILTRCEYECLKQLAHGRTAKKIALDRNITSRTAETHIYNIKNKVQCHTTSALIEAFWKNEEKY